MRIILLLLLGLGLAGPSLGDDKPASKPRPPLTKSVATWLQDGVTSGKLTEKEIVAKLGRPDRIEVHLAQAYPETEFIYEDLNRIDVDLKKGKVVRVGGSFSATGGDKKLNLEALGRVKKDMREADVRKALGVGPVRSGDTKDLGDGITRYTWKEEAVIRVSFQRGKYIGVFSNVPPDAQK
jgi:hypothetical protein